MLRLVEQQTAEEINRLYWDTDESVGEISNKLGLSRRALYEVVQPLQADLQCTSCGADMVYTNRSAKAAGVARCQDCGRQTELDPDISHEDVGTIPGREEPQTFVDEYAPDLRNRAVTIAGYALAGAFVGALATVLIRRKR
jgi:hypothetical protein